MTKPETQEAPHYLKRVSFSSPEEILQHTLGKKHGQNYLDYRRDYYRSLEADKHGQLPEFAHTVTMEFVNRCNLSCQMCYVANHAFPKATLKLETVKQLLDGIADHGKTGLLLGVGSEGLLYKDIREVVAYAGKVGIIDIILMTNGILLTPEFAEFLVRQEVSRVCISVDAATAETYKKVRGMDELAKLEQNIRSLVAARERLGSTLPVIRLSFCVIEENQLEQEAFREKWEGIVDYIDYQKVNDFSYVGREQDAECPPLAEGDTETLFCSKPFGYLNVWSNGDISPCCTFYGKSLVFGNVETDTLEEVYDGDQMADLRRQFLGKKSLNKVCQVCIASRGNLIDENIQP